MTRWWVTVGLAILSICSIGLLIFALTKEFSPSVFAGASFAGVFGFKAGEAGMELAESMRDVAKKLKGDIASRLQ